MDMVDRIECLSSMDSMEEDDDAVSSSHLPRPFLKTSSAAIGVVPGGGGRGGGAAAAGASAGVRAQLIPPATSVHELLDCPVCTNSMYPPIHQCQNGHTLCSTCKARVHNRCPTCRQELGAIRCLALEKVAESLEVPCKYYSLGCPEIFPYCSKLKHELQCNFRPYNCPYAGSECSVVGDIPFLVSHLRDDHKYFCLHFEAFQLGMAPVYMEFLRFMGDENEARTYSYSLEVGANGRKMTWEGTPPQHP